MIWLTKSLVFKIPNCSEWRLFLCGLLANLQERTFAQAGWPELCPIKFSLPLGFLIVMPRVKVLTEKEFETFDYERFVNHKDYHVPVEAKRDSFGWLDGKIVAVDYGS
jgi:hypothetical protein